MALRFAFLTAAVVLFFLLLLAYGSAVIPLNEVLAILGGSEEAPNNWPFIVTEVRLPKAWTAVFAGASLAVSGLLMQTLFRNPLAGPYVLGISSGASLAVAITVLGGGGALALTQGGAGQVAAASFGAGTVLVLVVLVARRVTNLTLLILGVLFGYATSALVTLLMHFSLADRVQAYINWTFGSLGGVTRSELKVLLPVLVVGLVLAFLQAKSLNALLLGEPSAASLGVAVGKTRLAVLISTALLAGAVTAFCGPVGFLGVAVPHLARGFFRSGDHRILLPGTALLGALFALMAGFIAEVPGSQLSLPLNAVTSLVGAPIIIAVILRRPPEVSGVR